MRYADLDPLAKRYLDLYSRTMARIEWFEQAMDMQQKENASSNLSREYVSLVNAATRLLDKVEQHVYRVHAPAEPALPQTQLDRHLATHYSANGDSDD